MLESLSISVNGKLVDYDLAQPYSLTIRETDILSLQMTVADGSAAPEVYIDDVPSDLQVATRGVQTIYTLEPAQHLSERFGRAAVRIVLASQQVVISFEVLAKRATIEQAHRMIRHLTDHSAKLIQACFDNNVQASPGFGLRSDSQAILAAAEGYIRTLGDLRAELFANLRKRLVPVKKPYWQTDMVNYEIDPADVLANLDALIPTEGEGDVVIGGQHFDMTNLSVDTVEATADVAENQVLLGGLYAIRRKIATLKASLKHAGTPTLQVDGEYGSFQQLQEAFGPGAAVLRCEAILSEAEGFIHVFESSFGITYAGERRPTMTPFSRSTRVYRMLFVKLGQWYGLGEPADGYSNLPARMRSLTKIYEIYSLFNLIESLLEQGWRVDTYVPHAVLGESVPSEIGMRMAGEHLVLRYDPVITTMSDETKHMDLVDVWHAADYTRAFWTPDFVIQLTAAEHTRYLILDSKYSHRYKVREKHVPETYRKYYAGTAVYDATTGMLTSAQIVGVFVVYALDADAAPYVSYGPGQTLDDAVLRIPMAGGIPLNTTDRTSFKQNFSAAIKGLRKTIPTAPGNRLDTPRLVA